MEPAKDILHAIATAQVALAKHQIGESCACSPDDKEDVECGYCFLENTLERCRRYIEHRMATANYTELVNQAAVYPGKDQGLFGIIYAILGLVGEAGEAANELKKEMRDNPKLSDLLNKLGKIDLKEVGFNSDKIAEELADIQFYASRSSSEIGMRDYRQILAISIGKIREKRERILAEREARRQMERDHKSRQWSGLSTVDYLEEKVRVQHGTAQIQSKGAGERISGGGSGQPAGVGTPGEDQ